MMSETYIKLFEGLIERLTKLVRKQGIKRELNRIIDKLLSTMNEIWDYFKKQGFNITEKEKREFEWKLEKIQNELNGLVENYQIIKKCTRCKKELLATTENFYLDRNRKGGLTSVCKECTKEKYRKNRIQKP